MTEAELETDVADANPSEIHIAVGAGGDASL
jgi:hypothetical protein